MSTQQLIETALLFLVTVIFIFLIRFVFTSRKAMETNLVEKGIIRLSNLQNNENYQQMLEAANFYTNEFPDEIQFKWYKALALFEIEEFKQASDLFKTVADFDPIRKIEAEKFLEKIESQMSKE